MSRPKIVNGVAPPPLIIRGFKGLVLIACCAVVLLPFLAIISTSLAGQDQLNRQGGYVLWPTHPNLDAYRSILAGGVVSRALVISIGITAVGTVLGLAITTSLAYALSWPGSLGHKPLLLGVLFTMLFAPGILPSYLMVRTVGLIDSWWSLIIPVLVNAFSVIVMRAFFMELPQELLESAKIDGASELRILVSIVLPLSRAVLAVIGLFFAVSFWNAFFNALLYINDASKWPLQLVLRTYVVDKQALGVDQLALSGEAIPTPQSLQTAILMISLIPILLVYPFLQRHFAKGVMLGGVKG